LSSHFSSAAGESIGASDQLAIERLDVGEIVELQILRDERARERRVDVGDHRGEANASSMTEQPRIGGNSALERRHEARRALDPARHQLDGARRRVLRDSRAEWLGKEHADAHSRRTLWPSVGSATVLDGTFGETSLPELRHSIRLVQAAGPYDVEPELTAREVVETGFFGTLGFIRGR
jgi:hypothetical protein